MKTTQSLKYLLFAGIVGVWGCSSQQYSQNQEYDDLYFSSKDREQVTLTASASSTDYSNIENKGVASEDYSQKNVNPEYIQQYADQNRQNSGTTNNDSYSADDNSYYDENYSRNNNPIGLARGYERYNNGGTTVNVFPSIGFGGGYYGGSAFYDPFYDPYFFNNGFYDPFFNRPFYGRPGWNINISYNYGWGSPWGWGRSAYWYDPFYNPYRSWGYWGDPYYSGFYNRPYYGWGGGWNRNNVIIVNPGNDNGSRQVRTSPRSNRGSAVVNDNFNNTPRTTRDTRGGRVDQSEGAAGTNTSPSYSDNTNRRPSNVSTDESRPARAIRPRSDANPDYQPQNTQPSYNNNSGNRTYSPNVNNGSNDGGITNPRAVRPRSNNDSYQNQNSNRSYDNNSNRSSAPTYNSTPSSGRSPRTFDNSRSNNSWNNNSSNDSYRSNGSFNNNSSGGSYSSPSSAPSRSSSSGSSSGGSSPRRSPR